MWGVVKLMNFFVAVSVDLVVSAVFLLVLGLSGVLYVDCLNVFLILCKGVMGILSLDVMCMICL